MHFADGAPSRSFPNPTLNLGYPVPSTNTGKKRAPPKPRTPVTVRASKRQKLNIQSPSTEDAQNRGTSKEDTPKTSGSDPGNDPGTDLSGSGSGPRSDYDEGELVKSCDEDAQSSHSQDAGQREPYPLDRFPHLTASAATR
uniref:Uncharacterized protein n=1 Tax=Knipowitschia caucasica TaxID=637954 RepID=A0AAV2J7K2_KNICA